MDYWLGGLVTAGIAPQFTESGGPGSAASFDAPIRRWLLAYRDWGHMQVGGVRTLRYDTRCCHTQGECEWTVCNDVRPWAQTFGVSGRSVWAGRCGRVGSVFGV